MRTRHVIAAILFISLAVGFSARSLQQCHQAYSAGLQVPERMFGSHECRVERRLTTWLGL